MTAPTKSKPEGSAAHTTESPAPSMVALLKHWLEVCAENMEHLENALKQVALLPQ